MNKKRLGIIVAALAIGVVAAGFAHRGHCGSHDPERIKKRVSAHLDDVLDDLNATPAQRAKITSLKDNLLNDGTGLMADHKKVRGEILKELRGDNPDTVKLHALVEDRANAYKTFAHKMVDSGVDAHQALTPEQRKQLTKKFERHLGDAQ